MKPMIRKSSPYVGYFPSFFDDFFNDFGGTAHKHTVPAVNVKENESQYILEIASPGMTKEDFNLEIEDDRLIISAEVKKEESTTEEKYTRKEFSYQSFKRSFALPEGEIIKDKIEAKYEDGVLRIVLPKQKEEAVKASKHIAIS